MASKNFLLVSLEENKAKQLAQIVSNDVCRKILDHLAAKDRHATETEISQGLSIPISTVHYNLQQLLQSGIVKAEEFHYSKKGREVLHYSLANKYIIIAPKNADTAGLASKLRRILPVVFVVAAAGAMIQFLGKGTVMATYNAPLAAEKTAASIPQGLAATATQQAAQAAQSNPNHALWFVIGGMFALAAYLAYLYIIENRNKA